MELCTIVSSRAVAHQTRVADLARQAKAAGLSSQVRIVLFLVVLAERRILGSLSLYPRIGTNSSNNGARQSNRGSRRRWGGCLSQRLWTLHWAGTSWSIGSTACLFISFLTVET